MDAAFARSFLGCFLDLSLGGMALHDSIRADAETMTVEAKHGHLRNGRAGRVGARRTGHASVAGEVGSRGDADSTGHGATTLAAGGEDRAGRLAEIIVVLFLECLGEEGGLLGGSANGRSVKLLRLRVVKP